MQEKRDRWEGDLGYGNRRLKVLIQLVGEHEISGIEQEFHAIQEQNFRRILYGAWRVNNWNDELSP